MKAFLTLIVFLTFTLSAHAQNQIYNGWSCVAKDAKNARALEKLKIADRIYTNKKLILYKREHCGFNSQPQTLDVCHFEDLSLYIFPKISILQTSSGATIKLECKEDLLSEYSGGVGGSN